MKQIIAIGGGGFGREIKDLKIEKYIRISHKKKSLKFVLYQQQLEMIKDTLIIFIKPLIHWIVKLLILIFLKEQLILRNTLWIKTLFLLGVEIQRVCWLYGENGD